MPPNVNNLRARTGSWLPEPACVQTGREWLIGSLCVCIMWLAPSRATGDLIRTKQEDIPCRIVLEEDGHLMLITGDAAARLERKLPAAEVEQHYQAADEVAQIESCKDAAKLTRWTAAYYRAGYESLARRCLRRAMDLDRAILDTPLSGRADRTAEAKPRPSKDFVRFWNLIVLDVKAGQRNVSDIPGLLKIARWAHRAGLKEEAAYYLRKAWSEDRSLPETSQLASQWGMRLEGMLSVDLTAAIEGSLLSSSIRDEGLAIGADTEKEFFTLPIRFDSENRQRAIAPADKPLSLARNTLKGRDAKECYGVRPLIMRDGLVRADGLEMQPVYERILLHPGEGPRLMAELRNQLGPRTAAPRPDDDRQKSAKFHQPRLRGKPVNEPATGWAAFIFEVPAGSPEFKVQWPEGGEETLDLAFIRQASVTSASDIRQSVAKPDKGPEPPGWPWSSSSVVASTLYHAQSASPAMAALAIERLRRIRTELGWRLGPEFEDDLARWSLTADEIVLRAALRSEDQVRLAAYRYFCEYPLRYEAPVSAHALELLSKAEPDLQLAWVRILQCGLRMDDCGHWWRQSAVRAGRSTPEGAGNTEDAARAVQLRAAILLQAILRSSDAVVCTEALDVLMALPASVTDWKFMRFASAPAQGEALSRIHEIKDEIAASRLLAALMLSARPEVAQDVAREARTLGLRVQDAESAVLAQWDEFDTDERRAAFLNVLRGIALGELVYSPRFSRIIAEAGEGSEPLREAAANLLIAQLRLRRENCGFEFLKQRDTVSRNGDSAHSAADGVKAKRSEVEPSGDLRRRSGPFPLMIDPTSIDPLVAGVAKTAQTGRKPLRREAIRVLLELGYADDAAKALIGRRDAESGSEATAELDTLLRSLAADPEFSHSYALLSLFAQLLRPGFEDHAAGIIDHLSAIAAATPSEDRWRIRAALKSGIDLQAMDELARSLSPPASYGVERWLIELCHMTQQDRQRLLTADSAADRIERLAQINLRRGRLVDGRYGGLAVMAITTRVEATAAVPAGQPPRWHLSRRITVPLPTLTLHAKDHEDGIEVRWQDTVIGDGRVMEQALPLRSARAYFPVLQSSLHWWDVARMSPVEKDEVQPAMEDIIGPLRLPSHKVLRSPTPGTMTLNVSGILREAIREAKILRGESLEELVPPSHHVTVRYRIFGCFSGTGTDVFPGYYPPDDKEVSRVKEQKGDLHLLNVMVVLEKVD